MLISRAADNPSGHRNRHAKRASGGGHTLNEGDEHRLHLQTPQSLIGRLDISGRYLLSVY
jgi:hypothetical protein